MVKGILFDYGGTIDTNGIHWGEVLWDIYQQHNISVDKETFKKAFGHAEKMLAINPLVLPTHSFLDMLDIKVAIQFDYLITNGVLSNITDYEKQIKKIAAAANDFAIASVNNAKPVLEQLAKQYPLVLVSNFYGNINTVLKTFGVDSYFKSIIESAVVGVRKPDPQIFVLGTQALNLPANDCVVIGDSYTKDIAPASAAGCKTIWLRGKGWGDDPADVSLANVVITQFKDIPSVIAGL